MMSAIIPSHSGPSAGITQHAHPAKLALRKVREQLLEGPGAGEASRWRKGPFRGMALLLRRDSSAVRQGIPSRTNPSPHAGS